MKNWAKGFDGTQQTLPKILQANGYETAVIGKWHLISKPTGFDHWMILDDQENIVIRILLLKMIPRVIWGM